MTARLLTSCLMILLGRTAPVWANAGPSETSVNVVADPVGIEDVRIEHESLTIDLRPLETGDPAVVEAEYHLENDGPEQSLDLLFAFGTQENSDFRFTFNGQPVSGVLRESRMPAEWTPPRFTPGLDGDDDMTYAGGWTTVLPMSFSIAVPPGPSVLSVRYLAGVKHTYARPAMYRQFAYILAPARSWAGFGGLEMTVHVPDDWSVASRPALQREGGLLSGRFDSVPADAIGLTLRPPVARGYRVVKNGAWWLFVVMGNIGLLCCWRWSGGSGSGMRRVARAAAIGLSFGVFVLVTGLAATLGVDALFPPTASELALVQQLKLSDGYGSLAAVVGLILLSVLAASVGGLIALYRRRPAVG